MLRVVFPTNTKLSYISSLESNFEESNYLTVLNVTGQNITSVEMLKNPHPHSSDEIIKECKDYDFGVLILPQEEDLPFEQLKANGVSVYKSDEHKSVLNAFSDFVQDKLIKM